MQKQIILHNKRISYDLRKSRRAWRMRICVYCDGSVVVTMPHDSQETVMERFIREKASWLFSKIDFFKQFQGKPMRRYKYGDYRKYKDMALRLAEERIAYFNKLYGYRFNRINVKNQKTRWGSCSKKGNLNFNYKIAFLEQKHSDYIIVHELCHLKELNHSRKFWDLVFRAMPDYLKLRNEIKKIVMS